tara:strand:+ start:411 stop:668 length:258 start_codon:yes stop_codon:yes gene_type:complete
MKHYDVDSADLVYLRVTMQKMEEESRKNNDAAMVEWNRLDEEFVKTMNRVIRSYVENRWYEGIDRPKDVQPIIDPLIKALLIEKS